VENWGVEPDIEVDVDPALWRQGRDPQLEKAVEYCLNELKAHPFPRHKKPAYPNYFDRPTRPERPGDARKP
jgi:tricorn protease